MPTSTVRAVILVAAIAVGLVVLTKAFPSAQTAVSPGASPSPSVSSPGKSPKPSTSPSPSQSPRVKGVVVQVLNGSTTTGLANKTSQTLKDAGYTTKIPGNAGAAATTTVYYGDGEKLDAEHLQEKFFPDAALKPAPSTFPPDVDITVVLGEDYATSASPTPSAT
jgi:LytR cell envelope-related transcriptional attenuator